MHGETVKLKSFFKSFNVNNLSVCIGLCADQVTLRSARCNDKDYTQYLQFSFCLRLSLGPCFGD